MGNEAGIEAIIASLQELKASQLDTPVVKSANPSEEVANFFNTLTQQVQSLQLANATKTEEVVEEEEPVQKASKKAAKVAPEDEEADEENADEETPEEESGRGRKKKAMKSMEKSEVEAVVNSAINPINESITKLTELMTVMAQAQMQANVPVTNAEVPVVAEAPKAEEEVTETVEKNEDPMVARVDQLTAQISALVNALTAQPTQVAAETVETPVAKSEEALRPTVMHAQLPAYTDNPAYATNAHNPAALEAGAINDPQNAVASVMKSMGFIPSSPVVRRNVLGLEENATTVESGKGNEDVELMKSAEELTKLSFTQINRLRTQAGAW